MGTAAARMAEELARCADRRLCVHPRTGAERQMLRGSAWPQPPRRAPIPDVRSPYPGLYATGASWDRLDPLERHRRVIRSLALIRPHWTFCFLSAAIARGLEVSWLLPLEEVHTVAENSRRRGRHVSHGIGPVERELADGVPVTSAARTVFDCVRSLSLPLALAIADSALRQAGAGAHTLRHQVEMIAHGRQGAARARSVMALADPLAENGGESYARAVMLAAGFQPPELQVELPDPLDPGRSFRPDFLWREARGGPVAGELDGRGKYARNAAGTAEAAGANEALLRERRRESRLGAGGMRFARFSFSEVRAEEPLVRLLDLMGVPRDPRGGTRLPLPKPICGTGRYARAK